MKITLQFATILCLILVHNVSFAQSQLESGKVVIQPIKPITRELPVFSQDESDIPIPGIRSFKYIDTNLDGTVLVTSHKTFLLNPQRNAVVSILNGKLPSPNPNIRQFNISYAGDKVAYIGENPTHNFVHIANPVTKESITTFSAQKASVVDGIIFLDANAELRRLAYTYSSGSQFRGLVVLNYANGKINKALEVTRNSEDESPYETLDNIRISDSGNNIFYSASWQISIPTEEGKRTTAYTGGIFELSYENGEWIGPTQIEPEGFSAARPIGVAKDGTMLLLEQFRSPSGIFIMYRTEEGWSAPFTFIEDPSSSFNKYTISTDGKVIAASEARRPLPPPRSDAPIFFDINVYFYDETAPNMYRRKQLTNDNVFLQGQHLLSRDGTRLFWKPEWVQSAVQLPGN